jgi:hypothetical protein
MSLFFQILTKPQTAIANPESTPGATENGGDDVDVIETIVVQKKGPPAEVTYLTPVQT